MKDYVGGCARLGFWPFGNDPATVTHSQTVLLARSLADDEDKGPLPRRMMRDWMRRFGMTPKGKS